MTDGFSQRTPQQALAALLERFTPQRLLLVGTRFPALDAFAQAHPQVTIDTAAEVARRLQARGAAKLGESGEITPPKVEEILRAAA